jgi:hypothetical protein
MLRNSICSVFAVVLVIAAIASAGNGEWVSLFDGQTLEGWTRQSGSATYEAKDGMIVGTAVPGSGNTFLCKGSFSDFILELEVLCDRELNSGVQIRSYAYEKDTLEPYLKQVPDYKRLRKKGEVVGYQCEIANAESGLSGHFWDEGRQNKWLDGFFQKPEAKKALKDGEWNHFRVIAQGNRIRSWINGIPCADFRDTTDTKGLICLQVSHILNGPGPYQVRFRNIRIRELEPGEKVDLPPKQ